MQKTGSSSEISPQKGGTFLTDSKKGKSEVPHVDDAQTRKR